MLVFSLMALLLSSTAHADLDFTHRPAVCTSALPAAREEYDLISAALSQASVPADRLSEDSRRAALMQVYNALQNRENNQEIATLVFHRLTADEPPSEYYTALRELTHTVRALSVSAMPLTCALVDNPWTLGGEIRRHNYSCDPQGLQYPSQSRSSRTLIHLTEDSAGMPELRICDSLILGTESADEAVSMDPELTHRLAPSVSQCLSLSLVIPSLVPERFRETTRAYVFAGVMDGCFGDPSEEFSDFESYYRHRMRYSDCF
jgi:hypothetical protein